MKRYLIYSLLCLFGVLKSQNAAFYSKNVPITIRGNTSIDVKGDVTLKGGSLEQGFIINEGIINVAGDLRLEEGKLNWGQEGEIKFLKEADGSSTRISKSGGELNFRNVAFEGTDAILENVDTLKVRRNLRLSNAKLNIRETAVLLNDTLGKLVGENEQNYAFGSPGYIETLYDSNGDVDNLNGIGLGILGARLNLVRVRRHHSPANNVSDRAAIARYYYLTPLDGKSTVSDSEKVTYSFSYRNDELLGYQPEDLAMYQSKDFSKWRKIVEGNSLPAQKKVVGTTDRHTPIYLTLANRFCEVNKPPSLGTDSVDFCAGTSVEYSTNTLYEHQWSGGSTADEISITESQLLTLTFIDNRGCISIDSVDLFKRELPVPQFEIPVNATCEQHTLSLETDVSLSEDPIRFIHWDFGVEDIENDTSDLELATYTYDKYGEYNVQLRMTSIYGCSVSVSKKLYIHPLPLVDYTYSTATEICARNEFAFENQTQLPEGQIGEGILSNTWLWDNGLNQNEHPEIAFESAGEYSLKLIATSNAGCQDSVSKLITVRPLPQVDFAAPLSACTDEDVLFTNASLEANFYEWTFGNGLVSNEESPLTNYAEEGNYEVQLLAANEYLCRDSVIKNIAVYTTPESRFSIENACEDELVAFINESTTGTGITHTWKWGNGDIVSAENPEYTYVDPASYTIELTVATYAGCADSSTQNITIYPAPKVDFTVEDVCADTVVTLVNQTTLLSGEMTYLWELGDETTSEERELSYQFVHPDNHTIRLEVTSDQGCARELEKEVNVFALPQDPLADSLVTCGDSMWVELLAGQEYDWSTGDQGERVLIEETDLYYVEVTNQYACSITDTFHVQLNTIFVPHLGEDREVCDSLTLHAYNPLSTYDWSNGSSEESILVETSDVYWVKVVDQNGCEGSDTVTLVVNESPQPDLGEDIRECFSGEFYLLDPKVESRVADFLWSTGETESVLIVQDSGMYEVEVVHENGCFGRDSIWLDILPIPVFEQNDSTFCGEIKIVFPEIEGDYQWNDGHFGNERVIDQSGNYTIVATNEYDCNYQMDFQATALEVPEFSLGNDTVICFETSLTTQELPGVYEYVWWDDRRDVQRTFDQSGQYWVRGENDLGCVFEDTLNLTVNPKIPLDLGEDLFLCLHGTQVLHSNVTAEVYQWYWENELMSQNAASVEIDQTGYYELQVTDQFGCQELDEIYVEWSADSITSEFLAASQVLIGDTLQFVQVSHPYKIADEYYWDFGDGVTSSEVAPLHTYFVSGEYDVQLIVVNGGCVDTTVKTITVSPFDIDGKQPVLEIGDFQVLEAQVYPNPNKGDFTLKLVLNKKKNIDVVIRDLRGNVITSFEDEGEYYLKELSLPDLSSGMYLMDIWFGSQRTVLKFVKE